MGVGVNRGPATTIPDKLRSLGSTLSFKLFLVLSLKIFVLFGGYVGLSRHFQSRTLENEVKAEAYRSSDLIKQSLYTSMLRNERERTYAMIRLLAAEPGVGAIRIYNKQGEIKFSSDEGEIGQSVDLRAEACYVCHATADPLEAVPTKERARIYRKEEGHRVLGMINPIQNADGCWNARCHAHQADQSILGVLDVQMSMEALDAAVAHSRRQVLALAIGIILLAMALVAVIVYRAVHRPTHRLRQGTEELARGNLDVEIALRRSDELGALAMSFNHMARSLKAADAELRAWSQTLEDRVQEKTAELDQMNRQIIQVERSASLGRMAATVAHELNNPLSGILTYAKLITKRIAVSLPESQERERMLEQLELIRSESLRCGNIVRDLLTYARGRSAELQSVHLHALIDRALRLVAHHVELGGVTTTTELSLQDDRFMADGEQVVQALIALLINAVEAMPDGGPLIVRTVDEPSRGSVCLSVTDGGIGIPDEVKPHIFDPFFSTKNEAKGVGLGLPVVYGIVQRHEGTIAVESGRGRGTTFTITLPRDPEQVARDRARAGVGEGVAE
ncbi:MAG: ATP-binding protein [Gemmatimonadota bacterium]|nr:ATP-binding protein [Gemmatimonadota bacterium]